MKPFFLVVLLLCPVAVFAQQNGYDKSLNGCWQNNANAQDLFVLNSDYTCMRINPGADTLYGRWVTRKLYSIPFPSDILVMKYGHGRKDKMDIGRNKEGATDLTDIRHSGRCYTHCTH